MTILLRSIIILSLLLLILAYFAYSKNRNSVTNKIFALFTIVTSIWLVLNIFPLMGDLPADYRLLVIRVIMSLAAIQSTFFYLFAHNFPQRILLTSKPRLVTLIITTIILGGLSLSPWLFLSLDTTSSDLPHPVPGPAMIVFLPLILIILGSGFFQLIKKYLSTQGELRNQIGLILLGTGLMLSTIIVLNFVVVVLFDVTRFVPFGIFGVCFFILFAAIAVFRYELLDIKIIVQEGFIATINIIFLTQIFFSSDERNTLFSLAIFLMIAIISFFALRKIQSEKETKEQLKKVARDLESANEELKHSIKERNNLYANISHEFKTPITVLQGNIEMAIKNSDEKKIIDHELVRMSKLTSELLELSRADSGKIELSLSSLDLVELFNNILEEVAEIANRNHVSVDLRINKALVISGDREKLYALFLNLVSNAIKYNRPSGKVSVNISETNKNIIVEVSDTGLGISREHLPKIFERFYRVDKNLSRKLGGTGLGLAIVKLMTELHGGTVSVQSEEDKGTKFTVCLPKVHPKH